MGIELPMGDQRIASLINSESETSAALAATLSPLQTTSKTRAASSEILYQPSSTSLIRWRIRRQEALAQKKQAHIAFMGDSIPFGAAGTGASNPKYLNSYPGQLRTMLEQRYGSAGSGIVLANKDVRANPAWDTRFAFGGASFLDHSFGLHGWSAYRLNGGSDATLDFTEVADEFWVYTLSSTGGFTSYQVDAQTALSGANTSAGTGGTIARESGYYFITGNAHNVFKIPTGSTASHTLKIRPSATAGMNTFVTAVEARINGNGRFRVSNVSISGKSLQSFYGGTKLTTYGDDTGLLGMPLVDMFKSDLLVLALGINDWQGQRALADTRIWLEGIINRQRASAASTGTVPANGDVVLLWNPKPDTTTLGSGTYVNPTWDAYRDLYYEVAQDNDVALIDLGGRWKDFSLANSLGLYADTIHPSDKGAGDMAGSVYKALFHDS